MISSSYHPHKIQYLPDRNLIYPDRDKKHLLKTNSYIALRGILGGIYKNTNHINR